MIQIFYTNKTNDRKTLIAEWKKHPFLESFFSLTYGGKEVTYDQIQEFKSWLEQPHAKELGILSGEMSKPIRVILDGYKSGELFYINQL